MKFYIVNPGDSSVGIPETQSTVEAAIDEHNEDWVRMTKESLRETFSEIFDDSRTYVIAEAELEAELVDGVKGREG